MKTSTKNRFDTVILNGRVIDPETMLDAIRNVGIKDGRIAEITTADISGSETIDAQGLVVSPGFIDTHFHSMDPFATKLCLRDGVTTGMDLESGALDVGEWYGQKETEGWQVNFGTTTALAFARMRVHDPEVSLKNPIDISHSSEFVAESAKDGVPGWSVTRSSIEQMNQVMKYLDEDLRQGALGVGILAAYMARGLTSYELFEAQRTAARYGRLASVHTRFHLSSDTPTEAPIAFDEVFTNAYLLNAPLLVAHDNDYGWWEIEEKLQLARAKGLNMWGEYYPYEAGSTVISADFLRPEQWEQTQGYKYEETIYDPIQDRFLDKAAYLELTKNDPSRKIIVYMPSRLKWMKHWLRIPHMTVGSDAMAGAGKDGKLLPWDADFSKYVGHPRTTACRARVLRMGREQGVPLMFSISQLSYWTAKHLGDAGIESMKVRGRVQEGMVADLTLFDPLTVRDNATYKNGENGLPSSGIPYVLVNGQMVVKDSVVLPVKAGQSIRCPVEAKGRFVAVDPKAWLRQHTFSPHGALLDDTGAARMSSIAAAATETTPAKKKKVA